MAAHEGRIEPKRATIATWRVLCYNARMFSMLLDFSAPYTSAESFFYDAFVAPAVDNMSRPVADELVSSMSATDVLEVGCGGGQLALQAMTRKPELRWVGLDLSAEQVARANKRTAAVAGVRFVQGSAMDLPFADASFDGVVSVASIKHWPDPAAGLAECVRVLRPGGRLVVVEADRGCHLDDARYFVAQWRIPALLRPISLAFFRSAIAGQAFDLDDARALLAPLPLDDRLARRIEATPALIMSGTKQDAAVA